jgi:peptidoglycan/xylan/chitin deacetylase (PgdA/CDA1 family)
MLGGNRTKKRILVGVLLIAVVVGVIAYEAYGVYFNSGNSRTKVIFQLTIPSGNERVVCITFDDGWRSQLQVVPILDRFGYKAGFSIVVSYAGYPAFVNWAEIETLAKDGNDVYCHSFSHQDLNHVSNDTLYKEVVVSQQLLHSENNRYLDCVFVYPYGDGCDNSSVRSLVSQNYLLAHGYGSGGTCNLTNFDRYNIPAIGVTNSTTLDDFGGYLKTVRGSNIAIIYYHQIGNGSVSTSVTTAQFEEEMQYLKDNEFTVKLLSDLFLKNVP